MDWTHLIENWFWFGFAALGFAILFNVPKRTLVPIFVLGAFGGTVKLLVLNWNNSVILATLMASIVVGFISIAAAHYKHSPPFVFAIPAVIPMVPGAFAYHTMKGMIQLANEQNHEDFVPLLREVVTNGSKTMFILLAIAVGVFAPMLLTARESAKKIKVPLFGK